MIGLVKQLQRSPYMPEYGTGAQDEPSQNDEEIIVEEPAKDAEAHVDSEQDESKR